MPFRRSITALVVLSVFALSAACGSRLSDEERALAIGAQGQGSDGSTDGSAVVDDGGVADPSATTGGDTTGGGTGGTTGGTTTGGSTGGTGGPQGAACAPGNATSTGVTKTEIKVGNVSQITGLVPGFGQTGVNGVKAYFNMVNNNGGVCGRKLTLVTADDRFQTATNRNETEKLANQVIAFVGNTSVVDDGGAPVVDAKPIADISLATTPPRVRAAMNFSPNPIDPTAKANGIHRILSYFKSTQGVKSAAIFYQDAAVAASQVPRYEEDFRIAGIPVVEKYAVAINATNFRSEATDIKEKKIELVITIAEIGAIANLAKAFDDVDYFPKVPFYGAQTYGQKLIQLAGPAAEGTEIGLIFAIPEEKASVPGMADFDTWYKRTAGGADADFFAVLSWVAASMFVEALKAAGPDPTQAKIIAHMKTVTKYTGGGIVAPINPAQKKTSTCFQVIEVKGGKWIKQHPAKGFVVLTSLADRARADRNLAIAVVVGSLAGIWLILRAYDGAGSTSSFLQFTLIGISSGCVFAIAASGLVLTYTTTGVFNFAHGAVGMVAAFAYYQLNRVTGVPVPLALLLVLGVLAPAIGLLLERILRGFRGAPPGTTLTVTIAITILLIGIVQYTFQGEDWIPTNLFGDRTVLIFGAKVDWDEVAFLVIAVGVAIGLRYLLRVTRTGIAMRAVVDNADLAALTGAPPIAIARTSWVLGSVLAALAGVLYAPVAGRLDAVTLTFFVLSAYGAAVFGRLRSLPLTFLGAIVLGLLQVYAINGFPDTPVWAHLQVGIPGIFLFLVLLVLPEAKLAVGRVVGRDTPAVPSLASSFVRAAVFVPAVWVMASLAGDNLGDLTLALVYGVLLLSLVVLTGYSGQISLAQYVFFGLGALAMGKVAGGDSILGMAAAAAIAVPLGIVTALPAMKLQGLYLALVTFALAQVSRDVIFQDPNTYGAGPVTVGRLELFGVSFVSNEAFAVLCGLVFALVAVGVLALRRGAFGRRLAAMRDSQAACATLGLDVRRTKLAVFTLSSAIAGLAGALYGGLGFSASQLQFEPLFNVLLFLFAFVGGITTITGALLGGLLFAALPLVQSEAPEFSGLVFAAIAVTAVALGKQPNGMAGLLFSSFARRAAQSPSRPVEAPVARPARPEVVDAVA